ncbi:Disease resistance protein RPM1 [Camellia lanceoleosa]|uniref:Disease resistance protein RPM1 n=1 Tax=Camellia lanceoleosa TaxID=1840588 RepID=A0ACC0GNS2_9ERIC|nr:Disease resistance protein RPM1 [Camellia lanceoleosa]
MALIAVSSVIQYLAPLLADEVKSLKGVRKEIVSIKAELERIQSFLEDAELRAETGDKGVKTWVKQVREVSYRIQDVIDEHILLVLPKQFPRCSCLRKVTQTITKLKSRHQIASQIQDIKTTICEIKEGADRYRFSTSTSSEHRSTNTSKDDMWRGPRLASLFIGDDEVVGIESPKYELISRLVDQNQLQRAVISVVGMGGIGKTTLAKKVYDSQEVAAHFNYKAWITVSQSYNLEELLKAMIKELSGNNVLPLPDEGIDLLIAKLSKYLYEKKYIIVFDDVWRHDFWESIRHALPKNSKGSRVIITTRSDKVAAFCKETSVDHVHELGALSEEKAWELFCKKAFQLDFGESRAETGDEGVKIWVKQVRQVAYRIQDVIDEHILLISPKQSPRFSCLRKGTRTITKLKSRHEIASQIQDIKTTISEIQEGAGPYRFSTTTSSEHSSSRGKDNMWCDPRLASLFIGDDEVIGIESPKYELISRLVDQNQSQRAVIYVVGMGGLARPLLPRKFMTAKKWLHTSTTKRGSLCLNHTSQRSSSKQ